MSRKSSIAAIVIALAAGAPSAQASVVWDWSFGGESGRFETDGDSAGPGTFTLVDFSVTASAVGATLGSLLGGQYADGQFDTVFPYAFVYDGAAVTKWDSAGANSYDWWVFDSAVSEISYFFGWGVGNVNDPGSAAWWRGDGPDQQGAASVRVTAANTDPDPVPVPEPGPLALLLTGACALLLARRRAGS